MSVDSLDRLADLPPLICPHTTGTARPLRDGADARRAARAVNGVRKGRPVHAAVCICGAWTTTTDAKAARASRRRRRR